MRITIQKPDDAGNILVMASMFGTVVFAKDFPASATLSSVLAEVEVSQKFPVALTTTTTG